MFGLSFLVPVFLLGGLAAAVPIALHLLRRERLPRVRFSDLRFLRGGRVEQTRRRRLRELLLLALRVAAILLLAAAFARPFLDDVPAPDRPATIVLVDTSFSLSGPGQAAAVRALAREAIAAAPADHLVGVAAFDDVARVVAGLAGSRAAARAAVDSLSPRPRSTRYREGLTVASGLIGAREGRVVVVTDLQASGWDAGAGAVSPQIEVEVRRVAPPAGNLAVVGIEPEPSTTAVTLFQAGDSAGDTRVSLAVDGAPVYEGSVRPEPGRSTLSLPVVLPQTGVARVTVVDPLGYSADDRRYRLLDPPAPTLVLVVTSERRPGAEALYLGRALAPGAEARPFAVNTVSAATLAVRPDPFDAASAVVLAGTRGLDRRGRDQLASFVRGGGGLLVVAGPTLDPAAVTDLFGTDPALGLGTTRAHADGVTFAPHDLRHPIMRGLGDLVGTLGQARFSRTLAVETGVGTVLAWFADGSPALVEHAVGVGRVLVFASDLGATWNDLPRRPTFVPFLHETVAYLAVHRTQPREFILGQAPRGAPSEPGAATLADRPGRIVLNVDPRESDPTPVTPERFDASVGRLVQVAAGEAQAAAGESEASQRLWRYALMLMALVLVAEGLLARRPA